MPRKHGDDGTYVETVPLEKVLEVFDTVDGPVILSTDVADELECSRQAARQKLQQLSDRGDLARRKVSRRVIYWQAKHDNFDAEGLQGDPETTLNDTVDPDTHNTDESDRVEPPRKESNDESDLTQTERGELIDLESLSFDHDLTLACREQLQEWLRYAAAEDRISKSDFDQWWTDNRVGESGYNSGPFWDAFAESAMKQSHQFSTLDTHTYRYAGDKNTPDRANSDVYDPTKEF